MFIFASLKIPIKMITLSPPLTFHLDTNNKSNSQCCQEERKWDSQQSPDGSVI